MATIKSSQTPVKVYRPSFLDTTGDLRPSVERELVTISNAFQTQQAFLDNVFPVSAKGASIELRHMDVKTPFIDFHYDYKNRLNEDFSARIINDDPGVLRFRRSDSVDEGYATIGVGTTNVHGGIASISGEKGKPALILNNSYPHQNTGTNFSSRITMNAVNGSPGSVSIWGEEAVNTYWGAIFEVHWDTGTKYFKMKNDGNFEANGVNLTSDITLKTNLKKIDNALDKVDSITGYSWDWKDGSGSSIGVIAQDVEKVLPEAVHDNEHKYLNYQGVIGLLINAVKELKEEVRQLKENK